MTSTIVNSLFEKQHGKIRSKSFEFLSQREMNRRHDFGMLMQVVHTFIRGCFFYISNFFSLTLVFFLFVKDAQSQSTAIGTF